MTVPVHIRNMGAAAAAGYARFDCADGRSAILIHDGLTAEEQAWALRLLLHDGESPQFVSNIPVQREDMSQLEAAG